jgi:hypothetical protein
MNTYNSLIGVSPGRMTIRKVVVAFNNWTFKNSTNHYYGFYTRDSSDITFQSINQYEYTNDIVGKVSKHRIVYTQPGTYKTAL